VEFFKTETPVQSAVRKIQGVFDKFEVMIQDLEIGINALVGEVSYNEATIKSLIEDNDQHKDNIAKAEGLKSSIQSLLKKEISNEET